MEEQPNLQAATAKTPPQALTHRVILEPNDAQRLSALCGRFDQNIKHLEKRLAIYIRNRGNEFQVSGPEGRVEAAVALLHQLYRETNHRETIEPDFVHLYLQEAGVEDLLQNNAPQGSVDSKTQSREGQSSSKGGGGDEPVLGDLDGEGLDLGRDVGAEVVGVKREPVGELVELAQLSGDAR